MRHEEITDQAQVLDLLTVLKHAREQARLGAPPDKALRFWRADQDGLATLNEIATWIARAQEPYVVLLNNVTARHLYELWGASAREEGTPKLNGVPFVATIHRTLIPSPSLILAATGLHEEAPGPEFIGRQYTIEAEVVYIPNQPCYMIEVMGDGTFREVYYDGSSQFARCRDGLPDYPADFVGEEG